MSVTLRIIYLSLFIILSFVSTSKAQGQLPTIFQLETTIPIRDIDWNFDSSLLAIADGNQDISVIDIETGQIEGGFVAGKQIAWNPVQNDLLIVNNVTKLWDYTGNIAVDTFDFPTAINENYTPVGNVDWHPTENSFAIVLYECEDGTPYRPGSRVEIWDVNNSTFFTIADCLWGPSQLVKWNPLGTHLAIMGFVSFDHEGFVQYREIQIWNVDSRERTFTITDLHNTSGLSWNPEGNLIAFTSTIGIDRFIQVYDIANGELISQTEANLNTYVPLEWHPSENIIATGGQDGTVQIWDAMTGIKLIELPVHTDVVFDVSWSPDGSMLASSGRDGRMFIWDVSEFMLSIGQ